MLTEGRPGEQNSFQQALDETGVGLRKCRTVPLGDTVSICRAEPSRCRHAIGFGYSYICLHGHTVVLPQPFGPEF